MIFQCWEDPEDSSLSFFAVDNLLAINMLSEQAVLLYQIQAPTWEAAMAQHHKKQGWKPYKPMEES